MKIVVITQSEPVFTRLALQGLLKEPGLQVEAVIVLPHYAHFGSWGAMLRYYVRVFGSQFIVRALWEKRKKRVSDMEMERVLEHGNETVNPPRHAIKHLDDKAITFVKQLAPELIISLSSSQRFPQELLKIPKKGCVNLHSGPLPFYRGLYPTFWQLVNGETHVGITTHFMSEVLDRGKIIRQDFLPILPDDTFFSLLRRVKAKGVEVLVETVKVLEQGKGEQTEEKVGQGSYYSFPQREDVVRLREQGRRLI